jgi:hypothetical protein
MKPLATRVPSHIQTFTSRADYLAKTGTPAPPFDYAFPVKDWRDIRAFSDADEEIRYIGVREDSNGNPVHDENRVVATREFRLFPDQAAAVNLLPEPVPAQGSLSPGMIASLQRKRPWPIELKPGERIVLAPGIGMIPVVDDGTSTLEPSGGFTSDDRARLMRIEEMLKGFTLPAPK